MRGAATNKKMPAVAQVHFYSRASCEARLSSAVHKGKQKTISTHAPHTRRGHGLLKIPHGSTINFYSRASCEARLGRPGIFICDITFLLTRLMRGAA